MTALRLARVVLAVFVAGALLVGLIVSIVEGPAQLLPAGQSFVNGVAGSPTALGATASKLTPILVIGMAATLAFRAGLFDVGQIGQFVIGAAAAGVVAPVVPGPGAVVIVVALIVGALAGATWSVLSSVLAELSGLDLIVLSLVANYLGEGIARLAVRTLFQDPGSFSVIATRPVPESAWLPLLAPRTSLHSGLILALAMFAVLTAMMAGTRWGHQVRMFGANPAAAALAGVDVRGFTRRVLAGSGAICGIAGGIQVLGVFHRYQDGAFGGSASVAWTGLTAAILVPAGFAAILPMALLLAALSSGFSGVQRDLGISSGLGLLLQGVVIIAAAVALGGMAEGEEGRDDTRRRFRHRPGPLARRRRTKQTTGPHDAVPASSKSTAGAAP